MGPFRALGAFFSAFFVTFQAVEKLANSVDTIAGIAEEEARGMAKQMAAEREDRYNQFLARLEARKLPAPSEAAAS